MNAAIVLVAVVVLAAAVAAAVGGATFAHFRRPWRARCPRDGVEAQIQVGALAAAGAAIVGGRPEVERCSHRWQVAACDEACVARPVTERRRVKRRERPLPGVGWPTVLVPLDGTPGSEAVLPTARILARTRGARLRLLRVLPPVDAVHASDGRVLAYADQESAGAEREARRYLGGLHGVLAGLEVEEVVRFGEPAAEILREAASPDVVVVAMASRPGSGLWRLLGRSVSARVERHAWVPVMRAPYRVAA